MINKVTNIEAADSYKFLTDQSTILRAENENKVKVNGINVIVDKPKRGDVLCLTHYTDSDGKLLDKTKQKIFWIDGLSIVPKELSEDLDPVAICWRVYGNTAYIRYRKEESKQWKVKGYSGTIPTTAIGYYICNNGVVKTWYGGVCLAKYYDYILNYGISVSSPVTSIDCNSYPYNKAVYDGEYGAWLRSVYPTYMDYIKSNMIKFPFVGPGSVGQHDSGLADSYALSAVPYNDSPAFPAAAYATSIGLNHSKLDAGKWYLPSASEMIDMMRDVTYDTSFWSTEPDIVNQVIAKLRSNDPNYWTFLSGSEYHWSSSRYHDANAYSSDGNGGSLRNTNMSTSLIVSPILRLELD
jgi:hypothetical protein